MEKWVRLSSYLLYEEIDLYVCVAGALIITNEANFAESVPSERRSLAFELQLKSHQFRYEKSMLTKYALSRISLAH